MWKLSGNSTFEDATLIMNRVVIGTYSIQMASFVGLIIFTYATSKLRFVYGLSTVFIMSFTMEILGLILFNWA